MSKDTKVTCVKHGASISTRQFYKANKGSIFEGVGYIPICKKCLVKLAEQYFEHYNDMRVAIYLVCRKIDIAFNSNIYDGALKENIDAEGVLRSYITQTNSLGAINGSNLPFNQGEHIVVEDEQENIITLARSQMEGFKELEEEMTDADYDAREEIIELLGYDPFESYPEHDLKGLYNDLINYLHDEEVADDQYLVSQIIQVVLNNSQIRKMNFALGQYMKDQQMMTLKENEIKSLIKIRKDIVDSNDKIAKENGLTLKSRGGNSGKKSSLGILMKDLVDMNFDDAEVDFYNQKKALGMKRASEISAQAIFKQLEFDEDTSREIVAYQREKMQEFQDKILDLEEENRKLYIKISNLKEGIVNA